MDNIELQGEFKPDNLNANVSASLLSTFHLIYSETPSIIPPCLNFTTQVHNDEYLCVERMCDWVVAVLEPRVKLLGQDECVWAERVSAEGQLAEVGHLLHLAQAGSSERCTRLVKTAVERSEGLFPSLSSTQYFSERLLCIVNIHVKNQLTQTSLVLFSICNDCCGLMKSPRTSWSVSEISGIWGELKGGQTL